MGNNSLSTLVDTTRNTLQMAVAESRKYTFVLFCFVFCFVFVWLFWLLSNVKKLSYYTRSVWLRERRFQKTTLFSSVGTAKGLSCASLRFLETT